MKKIMTSFFLLALIGIPFIGLAQFDDDPPPPPGGDPGEPVTEIPFDGGLSILLIAGAAYGIKRVREERKKL